MSKFEKVHKIITNLFLFNAHIELNISFLCDYGFYCAKFDICSFIVIYQRSGRYSQEYRPVIFSEKYKNILTFFRRESI